MNWCFCHNGEVPLFQDRPDFQLEPNGERIFYPVGETDSEATFCAILNALKVQFPDTMPSLPVLYDSLKSLCRQIVDYDPDRTILNFLLTSGPHLMWVYSWPGQRDGSKVWNGLHYTVKNRSIPQLCDADYSVAVDTDGSVCIVATKPLSSDEEWIELGRGELIMMDRGLPHLSPNELFRVELYGHGLDNQGKVLRPVRLEEDMRRYAFQPEFFTAGGI